MARGAKPTAEETKEFRERAVLAAAVKSGGLEFANELNAKLKMAEAEVSIPTSAAGLFNCAQTSCRVTLALAKDKDRALLEKVVWLIAFKGNTKEKKMKTCFTIYELKQLKYIFRL